MERGRRLAERRTCKIITSKKSILQTTNTFFENKEPKNTSKRINKRLDKQSSQSLRCDGTAPKKVSKEDKGRRHPQDHEAVIYEGGRQCHDKDSKGALRHPWKDAGWDKEVLKHP
jgi:hypothetical protein